MNQEEVLQVQSMEQEVNRLNEQLQLVEQNIAELTSLGESLGELEGGSKEVLANIGKKIFIPVTITDDMLLVDIGKDIMVKKTIPQTKTIVTTQIEGLHEVKGHIAQRLGEIEKEMHRLIMKIQKEHSHLHHDHDHDHHH